MATDKSFDWSIIVTIAIAFVTAIVSTTIAYSQEIDATHQRVAIIETKQSDLDRRLTRIEDKLDRVLVIVTRQQ